MAFSVFSKNGVLLPSAEATVPLSDIAYAYGFGVYESIRVVRGRALFLEDHLKRLLHSAEILKLEHTLDTTTMSAWVDALAKKTEADAFNIKMLLIGGKDAASATLFIMPLAPLFPDKRLYTHGAKAVTVHHERYLPHAKSLNMLPSFLAYRKAKNDGCYDALLVDRHGCITEGTRTNFFVIKGRELFSPPEKDILQGVTLLHVLDVAKANGFTVEYQPIPLTSLDSFDGAFLTSTSSKIMPLAQIDETALRIPETLTELIGHFDVFLKQTM